MVLSVFSMFLIKLASSTNSFYFFSFFKYKSLTLSFRITSRVLSFSEESLFLARDFFIFSFNEMESAKVFPIYFSSYFDFLPSFSLSNSHRSYFFVSSFILT